MGQEVNRHFWLGGLHAVEETLSCKPDCVLELLIDDDNADSPKLSAFARTARAAGIQVRFVPRRELDRLFRGRHQGAAVRVSHSRKASLRGFLAGLDDASRKDTVLVALDQIQDPHNLGAIARSAANLGAAGLIVTERRSSPITPAAIAASAGALQKIPIFTVSNLAQAIRECREAGFWIYGADAAGGSLWDSALDPPLVLVIGSEGEGLRQLVRSSCDRLVSIPQAASGVESLNASCAASVLLHDVWRRRSVKEKGR